MRSEVVDIVIAAGEEQHAGRPAKRQKTATGQSTSEAGVPVRGAAAAGKTVSSLSRTLFEWYRNVYWADIQYQWQSWLSESSESGGGDGDGGSTSSQVIDLTCDGDSPDRPVMKFPPASSISLDENQFAPPVYLQQHGHSRTLIGGSNHFLLRNPIKEPSENHNCVVLFSFVLVQGMRRR